LTAGKLPNLGILPAHKPKGRTGRSRYSGLAKTHLQNIFVATAINLYRLVDWLNEMPLAKTRQAAFVRLIPQNIAPN
jgi:hypothetical protein